MKYIMDFCFLAGQVWSGMSWYFPVTIGLGILVLASAVHVHAGKKTAMRTSELIVLLPFTTPFFLLVWGTVMRHQDGQTLAPYWPTVVAEILLLTHFPLAGIAIWKGKGVRLLAGANSLFAGWCAFWAYSTAVMAVTGDWI